MPRKTTLRAVTEADAPTRKPKKLSVQEAAASGDHRDLLVAMRERVAQAVSDPTCPPRDLAALTRRLQDIAAEIEQIDLRAKQEAEDDAAEVEDGDFDESAV